MPSCGYALVCLADENCLVADNVLQIIAKYTQDNILRDSPLAEVLLTLVPSHSNSAPFYIDSVKTRKNGCHRTPVSTQRTGRSKISLLLIVCLICYIIYYSVFKNVIVGIYYESANQTILLKKYYFR